MDPLERLRQQAESTVMELMAERDRLDAQIEPLRQKRAVVEQQIATAQAVIDRFLSPEEALEQKVTIQGRILEVLANGPRARRDLIGSLSPLTPVQINNALAELQKYRKIEQVEGRHGFWQIPTKPL